MLPVLGRGRRVGRHVALVCLLSVLGLPGAGAFGGAGTGPGLVPTAGADDVSQDLDAPSRLHLVTFARPGTVQAPERPVRGILAAQDDVLAGIDAPRPVYRWTGVLDGVAVELTEQQTQWLRDDPRVALVEPDTTHHVSGLRARIGRRLPAAAGPRRRVEGDSVVVGLVDTGLWPEHPVFAGARDLGAVPEDFTGACATTPAWSRAACRGKVVAARWFVEGFGPGRLHPEESLSARDVAGHGTQVASIALGNAGVTMSGTATRRRFSGVAPHSRVAVYKACWTAADPAHDGCAASDLVTAVDEAVRDGVDVLSLAVTPSSATSPSGTLERALLGAAEADVVVVGAAGHPRGRGYAGYPVPWVTTVGGLTSPPRRARVSVTDGPAVTGSGRGRREVSAVAAVLGSHARRAGARPTAARRCSTGSLAPRRVAGRVVVCRSGGTPGTAKSAAVARAGGVGMVLVDETPARPTADLHAVPTIHLGVGTGAALVRHLRRHPGARVTLAPGLRPRAARVASWSASGDPQGAILKPDLVSAAARLPAAVPAAEGRWAAFSGTSAAVAQVVGAAADLRTRHPHWHVARVHSALRTSAVPVGDGSSALRQGAGRLRPARAGSPGLVFDLGTRQYRRWFHSRLATRDLNVPSLLTPGHGTFTRRVTHVGRRSMYYSSSVSGFRHHEVRVEPAALRLDPGESATFRIIVATDAGLHLSDHGSVVWRGALGATVRMPVVLTR